jgi:hypothetical protein
MSNDKTRQGLPEIRITMSEPNKEKPSPGGSSGGGGYFKAVWAILASFLLYGALAVGGANIYQDVQFIRAYPDAADRACRDTGKC